MHRAVAGLFLSVAFSLLISQAPARAQQADTGVAIATFAAGGIFGLGAHGSVGGSLAAPVSKNFVPFIEGSYSPLTSYAFTYGANDAGKALFRSSMVDVNGGIRIRFPRAKGDWVPYIGLGAGGLRLASSTYSSGFGSTSTVNESHTVLAGNVSVGGLYYITPHLGFTVEVKGYLAQDRRFARATAGIFYQFP